MRNRAFTLAEVLIAAVLGLAVFGLSAVMYGFAVTRTSQSMASAAVLTQADQLTNSMVRTVRDSIRVDSITYALKSGLKCTLPLDGVDTDGDGQLDSFLPYRVNGLGPVYRPGKRVWFYFSDKSGDFTHDGPYLFRAVRQDDGYPTPLDIDKNWSFYYGRTSTLNYGLVDSILWSVDPANLVVTFTVDLSKQLRSEARAGAGSDGSTARKLRLSIQACWRNWRT